MGRTHMNILVIGNGFDLAHGLPTSYVDFLRFFHSVVEMPSFEGSANKYNKELLKEYSVSREAETIRTLNTLFEMVNPLWKRLPESEAEFNDPVAQELCENLKGNVWYEYLYELHRRGKMRGINWIDFESEISHIVETFDRADENLYHPISGDELGSTFPEDDKINLFLDKSALTDETTYRGFLDESYAQLRKFVCCMEFYLRNCVEKRSLSYMSPDIEKTDPNAVLCFNYTHTFVKQYGALFKNVEVHYIHGETREEGAVRSNNMVLGIDEYYKGADRDAHTNYNIYKKFTQRVINETGFKYREWIREMSQNIPMARDLLEIGRFSHEIYIFGHSLDITDRDILKDMIDREGVKTTIFYHDKQQQTQQIANLVKMLGQDKFIQMINSIPQQITFVKQQD